MFVTPTFPIHYYFWYTEVNKNEIHINLVFHIPEDGSEVNNIATLSILVQNGQDMREIPSKDLLNNWKSVL